MPLTHQQIELADLLPIMQEVFDRGSTFRLAPSGRSMLPTIREGVDSVLLTRAEPERVAVGDMVLYRRENGAFVLHRVVRREQDGSLTMRGDNQYSDERGILPSQLIATVLGIYHGETYIPCTDRGYLAAQRRRRRSYPWRRFFFRAHRFIRRRFFHGRK